MTADVSPAARACIGAVRVYQWTLRPFIGANCRFYPTCSEYAVEALRRHGALRGAGLAGWRVLRCNPWNEGGYDPVPGCTRDTSAIAQGNQPRGDQTGL